MKRCKYEVIYRGEVARFSSHHDAQAFGRMITLGGGAADVIAPDGVIGQYRGGVATPEFRFLDVA